MVWEVKAASMILFWSIKWYHPYSQYASSHGHGSFIWLLTVVSHFCSLFSQIVYNNRSSSLITMSTMFVYFTKVFFFHFFIFLLSMQKYFSSKSLLSMPDLVPLQKYFSSNSLLSMPDLVSTYCTLVVLQQK